MATLNPISCLHLASFFMLCKYLKYSTLMLRFWELFVIILPMVRILKQPIGFVVLLI